MNITTSLVDKYKEILANGENFEIIFVSSDKDEESASKYFESMPWNMLSFNDRDQEVALSKLLEVNSLPTLVLIDGNGETITSKGLDAVMRTDFSNLRSAQVEDKKGEGKDDILELENLKNSFDISRVFSNGALIDGKGNIVPVKSLRGKIVGLYFSAAWCPPCRAFTPILAEKYDELISEGNNFEIIFLS